MKINKCDDIHYIDSPGFGDPDKLRSDNKILSDIVETILKKVANFGLSSIL